METTPSTGLDTIDVKQLLGNSYQVTNGVPVAVFRWPFKFVFIDGCNSANGDWMLAFGILNNAFDYSTVGRRQRAFMGWSSITVDWLFSSTNDYAKFGTRFWAEWIANTPDVFVIDAIHAAEQNANMDPAKMILLGYWNLTWAY